MPWRAEGEFGTRGKDARARVDETGGRVVGERRIDRDAERESNAFPFARR